MAARDEFLATMTPYAMEAARVTGLDPRLILAQAALETGWGKSAPGHNYFGIKSHGRAGGNTFETTEYRGGTPGKENASFRGYASPEESFSDYAAFLKANPRYGRMLAAEGLDEQIAALAESGYATDPRYGEKVGTIAQRIPLEGGYRVAQAETMSDAGGGRVTDPDLLAKLNAPGDAEPVTDPELLAQLNAPEEVPGFAERSTQILRGMAADIGAGFQGVNPVGVSQQTPVGVIERRGDKVFLSPMDGAPRELLPEEFGGYVTQIDPKTGAELLYRRTPEIEESPAASAGRILGYGIMGGPGQGVRQAARATPKGGEVARIMAEKGVTPSLGMTGPAGARVAGAMESMYPTAGVAVDDVTRALGEISTGLEKTAATVGRASTRTGAGAALQEGANTFLIQNIKGTDKVASKSAQYFGALDSAIPAATRIDVTESGKLLQGFVDQFADAPNIARELGATKWQGWLDDIAKNGGQLTWEQVRALRSSVGEAIGKLSGPLSGRSGGSLKQLYGALTRDLDATAKAQGKDVYGLWKRANSHYEWASRKVKSALGFLFKENVSSAGAYENFMDLVSSKGRKADVAKLREIKRTMPEEAWTEVVATVIRWMGRAAPSAQDATGEAFSASTFLTDWAKISDEAKDVLFAGKGAPQNLRTELNQWAKLMERAKEAQSVLNAPARSGTTLGNIMLLLGGGAMGVADLTTAGATMGGMYMSARIMTNPRALRALRSYAASGGTPEAARRVIAAAGENRALAADLAALIRTAGLGQPSGQARPQPESTGPR